MKQQCEDNIHDWEHSSWGVIIGVSKCKKCGKVAKEKDFNELPLDERDSDRKEAEKVLTLIREAGWKSPEEVKQIENKAFKDGCMLNYEPDEWGSPWTNPSKHRSS